MMAGISSKAKEARADIEKAQNGLPKKGHEEVVSEEDTHSVAWSELTCGEQMKQMTWVIVRILLLLACLYFFICSLGLLEDSFQLLGGKTAGKTFQNSDLLKNPVAGLMIGVLATVLVQSSSTSTSIIITMVGSNIVSIREAIPIIMGANIGTSVTNTLVSLAQASDRTEFRRAFAGATVHDMFNWLSVLVLLPLEVAVHYLDRLTGLIVDSIHFSKQDKAPDMLKAITKPLTKLIVEVNKNVISDTAKLADNATTDDIGDVLKRWCETKEVLKNVTNPHPFQDVPVDCTQIQASSPLFRLCQEAKEHTYTHLSNITVFMRFNSLDEENKTENLGRCENLFAQSDLSDSAAGGILLVCSLIIIFMALYGIVKILHSLLHGSLAKVIRKTVNSDLPGKAAYFTGYIAILVGAGMTMILQSSSVFTSTLTPLVGVGVVSVERMYPLTLGANIGTTVTGILAALSQDGEHVKDALHVALCHLFFNISGIVLFFPIPFLRFPVDMAKSLGKTTAKHRWFAIMYLILLFVILPGIVFGLSFAGWVYLGAIAGPLFLIFFVILIINVLQRKRPGCLPRPLRSWNFLPLWMHSLKPVDRLIGKICRCGFCQKLQEADLGDRDANGDEEVAVVNGEVPVTSPTTENSRNQTSGDVSPIHDNQAFVMDEHRL